MDLPSLYHSIQPRYPELAGKVALVTGSSRGIGLGIALRLAKEGMRVIITSNLPAEAAETAQNLRELGASTLAIPAELASPSEVDALVAGALQAFGAIDLLVNNAADLRRGDFLKVGLDFLDRQVDVNIKGAYRCAFRAAEIMATRRQGAIINISSVGGLRAHYHGLPYDLTKGALDAMTRSMALELATFGIRVNAVAPGATDKGYDTPAFRKYREAVVPRVPLGRMGTPQDYASAVAFLASDDATYITGQVLYVDGGITAQLNPPGHDI